MTLVSAPAGYGKSALVSHWAESLDRPCAWLSLGAEDSDLGLFVRYLLAAVRTVVPGACPESETMVTAPVPVPVPVLGGCLVNEIDGLDTSFVLVLDDYHRIEPDSAVHELLVFLLDHLPRNLHLVLTTRSDPLLQLASLRGRGRITEVRARELRFSAEEIAGFLEKSVRLKVGPAALSNLERQTEGWIVALRLVALHLQQVDDPEGFLESLHGGTQNTREYLLLEVLDRLPSRMRDWMLKTATLDRFCPEVCEAVCGTGAPPADPDFDGRRFLEALSAGNLFLIALNAQGSWFRYHHLFQEMLRDQLATRLDPSEIAALHLRASGWFEAEGLISEAIEHALAGGDPLAAATIAERHRTAELDEDRWYVVRKWLDRLPEDCRRQRPALLLAEAWIAYEQFQLQRIPAILDLVAPLLDDADADPALLGEVQFFEGALDYWQGKGESSLRLIRKARARLPEQHRLIGGLIELYLGITRCMNGRQELAVRSMNARLREVGSQEGIYASRVIAGLYFVHHLSGDLVQAAGAARQLHVVAQKSGIAYTDAWSSYMQASGCLHQLDLAGAAASFAIAVRQRYILHARAATDALAGLALTQQLLQQTDAAAETVNQLERFALELDEPFCLTVAQACRARVSMLRGEVADAERWAQSFGAEPMVSEMFVWLEVPWISQARVLIAGGTRQGLERAVALLRKMRELSEACHFTCHTIEVEVLHSLALEKQGRADEALDNVTEVLSLAGPRGWLRPFAEAGRPMADLLRRLPARAPSSAFVAQILLAVAEADAGQAQGQGPGLDLLTPREQEILELLAQRLQYKEIATRLFISPQTVNSHLKNVYGKLGVGNRGQAIARARELGLLESP